MKIQSKPFLFVSLLAAVLAGPLSAAEYNSEPRPNIVVVMADDSGYSDFGSYGGEIDTPHLDALAESGVRFRSFYNNGRCSPSRASLLTGLESAKVGFGAGTLGGWNREMQLPAYRARLPYEVPLLPELLKEAGYRTLMAGKWHLGGSLMKTGGANRAHWERLHPGWELTEAEVEADFKALPRQRGFDRFFGIYDGETHQFLVPAADYPGAPHAATLEGHSYYDGNIRSRIEASREYAMRCYYKQTDRYPFHPADGQTGPAWFATDGTTDKAIEMVGEALAEDQPFFLYLAFQSPHKPLQAPQELVDKYTARYRDLAAVERERVRRLAAEGLIPGGTDFQAYFSGPRRFSERELEEFRRMAALHAAMTENMDANIGRLVKRIQAAGAWENTFFIFLSDNGAASHVGDLFNKPYRGCKAVLWEGGTKTPCIMTWPGRIEPGSLTDAVGWIGDLFTTSLAVAGASYPAEFRGRPTPALDGRNLLPVLKRGAPEAPEWIFFNDKGQQGVIQEGRWKLLIDPGWYALRDPNRTEPVYELYDLAHDPAETKNLAAVQPERVRTLARLCEDWQKKSGLRDYGELLEMRPDFSK